MCVPAHDRFGHAEVSQRELFELVTATPLTGWDGVRDDLPVLCPFPGVYFVTVNASDESRVCSWLTHSVVFVVLTPKPPSATALRRPIVWTVAIGTVGCPVMILMTDPELMQCGPHDAPMTVEHVATGRTWTDNEGYERQRAALERTSDAEW